MIEFANDITVGYASLGGQLEELLQKLEKPILKIESK